MRYTTLILALFILLPAHHALNVEAKGPGAVVVYRDADPRSSFLLVTEAEK